ncbi:MAG: MFS transporter [Xanthomonadales bacterium]|nr:MFS transporter [Xanthomonadales bacterium]
MTETLKHLLHPKFLHMTFFGFSAGVPYFLIFYTLSTWLDQVGVERSIITYFSWAALGYSFKFLWAPLVDQLPIPILTKKMGQRRSWLLFIQLVIVFAIFAMAMTDPATGNQALTQMALAVTLLGFSAATQDIVIDAWRIEASTEKDIAMLSSVYIVGYRVGMVTSGAGALYIAGFIGTSLDNYNYTAWQVSYLAMACCMLVGIITTLKSKEPAKPKQLNYELSDYIAVLMIFIMAITALIFTYQFTDVIFQSLQSTTAAVFNNQSLGSVIGTSSQLITAILAGVVIGWLMAQTPLVNKDMIKAVYWTPIADLFKQHRKHLWLMLGIVCTYKIADIVMGVTANLFYQGKGFTLTEIASITKLFGLGMTITGGLLGGFMVVKYGVMRMMILGAILTAGTNLLFMWMAMLTDKSLEFLTFIISADNLAQGFAGAVFVGFLSLLVNKQFTAVQYAMFSSVISLFPKILGGYSGGMVDQMGYANFYLMTTLIGIPVVLMLIYALRRQVFDFESKAP